MKRGLIIGGIVGSIISVFLIFFGGTYFYFYPASLINKWMYPDGNTIAIIPILMINLIQGFIIGGIFGLIVEKIKS